MIQEIFYICLIFIQFLNKFIQHCPDDIALDALARSDVQDWLVAGHATGLSPATLARRLSALRSLLDSCVQIGYCEKNVAAGVMAHSYPAMNVKEIAAVDG